MSKRSIRESMVYLKQYRFILFTAIVCLFCTAQAWAQTFTIPDVNFRNCLKATYPHIFDSNDEVIIAEAKNIKTISCIGKAIESIEGVGYFEGVESLRFNSNKIQLIPDITGLAELRVIQMMSNKIAVSPDLSGNTLLQVVDLSVNQLTVFPDITNNPGLTSLTFSKNQIQSVPDLSALTSLTDLLIGDNPLQSLPDLSANQHLLSLNISNTDLPVFPDLSQNINLRSLSFGVNPQFSVFPDLTHNTELSGILCLGNNMSSIPDLSAFTKLSYFNCSTNNLSSLPDLSKNPKLNMLYCENNHLTALPDLSKCLELEYFDCSNNNLTALPDLSKNTALISFQCYNNNLVSLPDLAGTQVGKSSESILEVFFNQLTFEDIIPVAGPGTFSLRDYEPQQQISGDASLTVVAGKPFTIDLNIDDPVTSNVYTWYKNDVPIATTNSNIFTIAHVRTSDAGNYRATVTNPNAPDLVLESGVTTLTVDVDPVLGWIYDDSFRACLKETYPWIFNGEDYVILAEIVTIKMINCLQKGISDIEGIGYFKDVEVVNLSSNQIQEVPDITGLTDLRYLYLSNNNIAVCPDLTGNTALQRLELNANRITVFPDITNNLNLEYISFSSNQLQTVPDLSAYTSLRDLSFSSNQLRHFPDLSALTSLTSLGLSYNPLQSFPDLSHNTALIQLSIDHIEVTAMPDISHNTNLKYLSFSNNEQFGYGTFPDLSHHTKLESIDCRLNGAGVISDLSACADLQYLYCSGNSLDALPDLSMNTKLLYLDCSLNYLTQLPDLSKCPSLATLQCSSNLLTVLPDLSGNTALTNLSCASNNLTSLPDISQTKVGKIAESIFWGNENKLTFEDILPISGPMTATYFEYKPQQKLSYNAGKTVAEGAPFTIDLNIDDNLTSNVYTWYKNDVVIATTGSNIFTIDHVQQTDAGRYRVTVTNPGVPSLTLESGVTTLTVNPALGWIADDNFRACLKATYPWIFNNQDYVILAETVTIKDITCEGKGIKDISGIEYFKKIETVYLGKNQISDVSALSALTTVYRLAFYENNISALPDLSACTVLQELHMSYNNFSTFPDVTANAPAMKVMEFDHNHLTSIPDLSLFQILQGLDVSFNPIETLPDLGLLPRLTSLGIAGTDLKTFPDLSGVEKLSSIRFGNNPQFSTWPANFPANASSLSFIDCGSNGLTVIPSLDAYPKLHTLAVAHNNLTALPDLSHLPELVVLLCDDNNLAALPDLSNLTRLSALGCENNNLHSLPDLSHTRLGSPAYVNFLGISGNHLTFEDLKPVIVSKTYTELRYVPQTLTAVDQVVTKDKNEPFVIDINIDDAVTNNVYKWYKDGVLVRTTSTNKLSFDHVQAADAGIYTCAISNPDAPDLEITWQKITLKVNTVIAPWEIVTGGNSNHVVIIPNNVVTDIYGTTIQIGDYAGIFFKDGSNALRASGSARWTGANTAITVWGKSDQGTKNGFDTGEEMVVMIWKADEQKSYIMSATYDMQLPYTDRGNFRANGFSKVLTMKVLPVCQQIDLHTGWNLISTYIKATDLSMVSIFGNTNGVVVKNASGRIMYAPGFGITDGSWNTGEGYLVYSPAEQSFEVCGRPINPATPISLVKNSYPAFLPYYGDAEIAVGDGLKGLGTNYSYAQTITYSGGTGQLQAYNYIPAHVINPPIDQIGYMRPGLAYKILLQGDVAAFSYPAYISSTGGRIRSDEATLGRLDHFDNVKPLTANNAVLVIPDNLFSQGLSAGDEIGVFSSRGELIGAIAYAGTPMAVTLWESGASGTADAFTVRLWRMEDRKEYTVDLTYANRAEGKFFPNTLLIANGAQLRDGREFNDGIKVYPNPANNDVQVTLYVADEGTVRIVLYDMMGRERGELFNGILPRGVHQKTVDLSAIPAGQYVYKVNVNHAVTSDKLVIVK